MRHDKDDQTKLGWPCSDREHRAYQLGGRMEVISTQVAFQGIGARQNEQVRSAPHVRDYDICGCPVLRSIGRSERPRTIVAVFPMRSGSRLNCSRSSQESIVS